jgi:hypothetical protein
MHRHACWRSAAIEPLKQDPRTVRITRAAGALSSAIGKCRLIAIEKCRSLVACEAL